MNGVEVMNGMEERVVRAKAIMKHPEKIERIADDTWTVPSQTGYGRYRVWFNGTDAKCQCPDYDKRTAPCKHIFAVMELQLQAAGQALAVTGTKVHKVYQQDCPAYNKGQVEEMRLFDSLLRELVSGIEDAPREPSSPGPAPTPLRDDVYCAILKVYSCMSGRRACGVYRNVVDRGLLAHAPSYSTSSILLTRPEVTAILYRLLTLSALPLADLEEHGVVAPDSTGIQTTSFGGWREQKHGEKRERRWLKVHAIVGTKTHIIMRAVVAEANSADCPQFETLLRGLIADGFKPDSVVADKGYLSRDNYNVGYDLGLGTYIPFKKDSTGKAAGSAAWHKAYHLFMAKREEFDQNYHKRSNVESVFSALKRKFGENIRSRKPVAQVNEVLCKLIAYNLTVVIHEMFEHGVVPGNQSSAISAPTSNISQGNMARYPQPV